MDIRQTILTVVATVIILAFISSIAITSKPPTFKEGFQQVLELDQKYGGDFHNERLMEKTVRIHNIPPMIADLETLKTEFQKISTNVSKPLSDFVDVRIGMLNTQAYYLQAEDIGDVGLAIDGFTCKDIQYLQKTINLYNLTIKEFAQTMFAKLDILYNTYPEYKEVIGFGRSRPNFYNSPMGNLSKRMNENGWAIQICKGEINITDLMASS